MHCVAGLTGHTTIKTLRWCSEKGNYISTRDVNRLPVNRITGYVTRDRFQLSVTDTRKSNCDLRHLAVSRDTRVDRKQIMIKSVRRSHCRRLMSIKVVTAPNLQRALSTDAADARTPPPTSHPLPDTATDGHVWCLPLKFVAPAASPRMRRPSHTRYCSHVYSVEPLTGAESVAAAAAAAGESQCREKVTAGGSVVTRPPPPGGGFVNCNFLTIVWTDDGHTDGLADDRLVAYYVIVCEVATSVGDSYMTGQWLVL